MKRRRLIAIVSVCTLLGLGLIAVVGSWALMRTDIPRRFVQQLIATGVNGTVYVGRISGNPFAGITVDSFAIRDRSGELFASTGKVTADYDIRDIMDTRLYLRHVVAEHPYVHFRQYQNYDWNFRRIFRHGPSKPKPASSPGRSWLDYMVFDSVRVIDGSYILSLRWAPDDNLTGRQLDSALAHELTRADHSIAKTADGYARTYSWVHGNLMLPHVRLADPDSNSFGKQFTIANLDADEFDPPFNFKHVRGNVKVLGDSVWMDLSHFDLPASTGVAKGKIVWGSDLPIRYDINVRGDSVALNDINWIYPTLPKTGGGKMLLHIGNKRDIGTIDYQLTQMDVHTTGSHVTGAMTFGVGQPILQVRNVDLIADPLDFKFLHTIAGKPLPINWQGQIYGSVRGAGGPLTEFQVDAAHGEWRDSHVPGAVSRFSGSGGLDILDPAFTEFHGFHVDVGTLDLRSIEYLFPAFPRLRGTIAGTATLDSIWTDVRFRNADIVHRDGPGKPSRFTGSGRITDGDKFITYDVGLNADSLNFTMLAQSYPSLGLRGMVAGPIHITGQTPDLTIDARLSGPAGQFAYSGRVDIDSAGGYFARGRGEFANLDLSRMLANPKAPLSSLTGSYDLDVSGASANTLSGIAALHLQPSKLDSIRIDSSATAIVRFANGRAVLTDTVRVRGPIGRAVAYGSIGLPGGTTADSIHVELSVDSVGALRPFIGSGSSRPDSLTGKITVNGVAVGRLDSLLVSGEIAGSNLFVRGIEAPSLAGNFTIFDALRSPRGDVYAAGHDVRLGGIRFDTLRFNLGIADTTRGSYVLRGATSTGQLADSVDFASGGRWSKLDGVTSIRIDSLQLRTGESRWALDRTATISFDSTMFAVDTAAFTNGKNAWIGVAGVAPDTGRVDFRVNAKSVPLADLNRWLFPRSTAMTGSVNLSAQFGGTLADLRVDASTLFDSIRVGDVRIGRLASSGHYQNRRASVSVNITDNGKQVLEANADSLPMAVTMFGYDTVAGQLHATITADSADFTIMQAFMTGIDSVKGKMSGSMTLEGSWSQPMLTGIFALKDAQLKIDTLGIMLNGVHGSARYAHDVLTIDSLEAHSAGNKGGVARISGPVTFKQWQPDAFDLSMTMSGFEAYNRPELARVIATTNRDSGAVRLFGTMAHDTLSGWVSIDKSDIFLPDPKISAKLIKEQPAIELREEVGSSKALLDRVTENLQTDLRLHLGDAVKLSADYADIPLTGDLRIRPITVYSAAANKGTGAFINRLAPEGTVLTTGGTYTFDLITKRDLAVQKGGTITFDRLADWNPLLNLTTRYTVRQTGHPDIPVIVDVRGRLLPHPELSFRTDGPIPIGESDLVSYLITGGPGFDLSGQSTAAKNLIVAVLFPTINTELTNAIRDKLGSGVRLAVESPTPDLDAPGFSAAQVLRSTRLSGEFQLTDKMFLTVSTSLCQNSTGSESERASTLAHLANPFAGSLEYRLSSTLQAGSSLSVSSEPTTQALLCSASGDVALRGVAPTTQRQYSLSWLHFWRW